jgi:hypothetical protein
VWCSAAAVLSDPAAQLGVRRGGSVHHLAQVRRRHGEELVDDLHVGVRLPLDVPRTEDVLVLGVLRALVQEALCGRLGDVHRSKERAR